MHAREAREREARRVAAFPRGLLAVSLARADACASERASVYPSLGPFFCEVEVDLLQQAMRYSMTMRQSQSEAKRSTLLDL